MKYAWMGGMIWHCAPRIGRGERLTGTKATWRDDEWGEIRFMRPNFKGGVLLTLSDKVREDNVCWHWSIREGR